MRAHAWLALFAAWGCSSPTPPPVPVAAELAGRAAVRADGTWLFDAEAQPRLWWPADAPPLRLRCRVGDGVVTPPQAAGGPQRLQVASLTPCAGLTALQAVDPEGRVRAKWPASLRGTPSPQPEVSEARAHMQAGDLVAAEAAWVRAAAAADGAGLPSQAARWRLSAAWCAEQGHRLDTMAGHVRAAEAVAPGPGDPQGWAALSYTRANLARRTGDFRGARRGYTAAAATFERFQMQAAAAAVSEAHALMLVDVGDLAGAVALLDRAAAGLADDDAPGRARLALNRGWILLLRAEAGADTLPAAERWLRRAAAAEVLGGPAQANAQVNLARAALRRRAPADAERALAQAVALDPQRQGPWAAEARLLEAQVALLRRDWAAAGAACAAEAARGDGPVHHRWRALACQARAADGAGALSRAVELQAAALEELGRRALGTSLREGRGAFLQARRALVQQAVGRLLRAGRQADAFAVADAGRARLLRASQAPARLAALSPAQRAAWTQAIGRAEQAGAQLQAHAASANLVPEDRRAAWAARLATLRAARDAAFEAAYAELDRQAPGGGTGGATVAGLQAALAADEALIAFAATPQGWQAFVVDRAGLTRHPVGAAGLAPVWRRVAQAAHLYVVAGGYLQAFSGFTQGDAPAALRWTVAWLPYAGLVSAPAPQGGGGAVVVGDPNHDLKGAYAEARWVARFIDQPTPLLRGQATVAAARTAFKRAAHIHFAGHGVLAEQDPWAAHLQLADGLLEVTDLLTIELAGHPVVVLSGCETGVDAVLLDEASVGLAEAFLALGARSVVATDREVADGSALAFMKAFYAGGGRASPARGVQAGARALRAAGDPHWSAFRVIGLR